MKDSPSTKFSPDNSESAVLLEIDATAIDLSAPCLQESALGEIVRDVQAELEGKGNHAKHSSHSSHKVHGTMSW